MRKVEEFNDECRRPPPLVLYVVVSALPRQAVVEWQVTAFDQVQQWQGLCQKEVFSFKCLNGLLDPSIFIVTGLFSQLDIILGYTTCAHVTITEIKFG